LRISINEIFAITIILCIIDWFVTDSLCVCSESSKESLILTPMKWCQVRFQCEVGHMECISRVLSIEPLTSQAINVAAIKATVVRYSQSFWLCYGDCLRRGEARRGETRRGGAAGSRSNDRFSKIWFVVIILSPMDIIAPDRILWLKESQYCHFYSDLVIGHGIQGWICLLI
jgi:hypothetical protein